MNTTAERDTAMATGTAPHVLEVIHSAEHELAGLLQQRAEIRMRINAIRRTLAGLAKLYGLSNPRGDQAARQSPTHSRKNGLTQACRLILFEARTPLRTRQGCDALRQRFPDLAKRHKDLSASLTTVFRRLVSYAEARCFFDNQGMRVWERIAEQESLAQATPYPEPTASITALPPAHPPPD
jgi:hypothetical protein